MRSMVRASKRGFTLIELMIVVAIVGILAVLAIYGVRKYLANAKTAEARNNIGEIAKDLGVAFEKEAFTTGAATAADTNTPVAISHNLCPSGAMLPATVPAAQKVLVLKTDWDGDPGWSCAKFVVDSPVYYSYQFVTTAVTAGKGQEDITAQGDLDGNGAKSLFEQVNIVSNGRYIIAPTIAETNPEE